MKKIFKLVTLAAAIVCASAANATLVIDDFTTDGYSISDNTIGGVVQHSTPIASPTANIIGGYRDVFISKTVNASTGKVVSSDVDTTTGTFSFNQDNDTAGTASLRWDGINSAAAVNTTGLMGVQLADAASGFEFTVKDDASGSPYVVRISVWDMFSNLSTFTFPATNTFGSYVPFFISFVNPGWVGAADFNNVGALQVDFNITGTAKIDVDIGLRNVQAVPEPETLALVGLALLAVGVTRRKARA